jgi:hypothetical protein
VVIKGPVATAGSIFHLSNKRGTDVPKSEANMMTRNSERLMVVANVYSTPAKAVIL